jgi:hypothetical protein
MVDSLQAETATQGVVGRDRKRVGAPSGRVPAAVAFLEGALVRCSVAVADLEVRARAAGLLGERQSITDSKKFRAAKKKLGIMSRRDGFGRGGRWYWSMSTQPPEEPTRTAIDPMAKTPDRVGPGAVYGGDHSRPAREHPSPSAVAGEHTPTQGISRDWGKGVYRLHHLPAHAGVPAHRWCTFLSDVDQFIQSPWAERAADLGWDAASLFGCHPGRPLDHLQGAGLLWRLCAGKIVGMHVDWAVIEVNGKEQVVHRRPAPVNFVLPWARRAH